MELVTPEARWIEAFRDMAAEFTAAGDPRYESAAEHPEVYLSRLRDAAEGRGLPAHLVPWSTYWLMSGGTLVGCSRLRHRLNPQLEIEGGHIGYDIRPGQRRKGYGTLLLRLTLPRAAAMGIDPVLVTCDADNPASARIIERNGGVFAGASPSPRTGKTVNRYHIQVRGAGIVSKRGADIA